MYYIILSFREDMGITTLLLLLLLLLLLSLLLDVMIYISYTFCLIRHQF